MVPISKEIYFQCYLQLSLDFAPVTWGYKTQSPLSHPNLCGFYRTALYFVPRKDDKGIEIYEDVSPDDSINDVKAIFNNRFNMSELNFVKFDKHKDRFLSIIAKWGKNRGREDKELYLNTFSVVNWLALNESTKLKHTVLCNECEITHLNVHAKFPSNSPMYSAEKTAEKTKAIFTS